MTIISNLFRRGFALCYFFAFFSMFFQYQGLWGSSGVSSIANVIKQNNLTKYLEVASIFVYNATDNFLFYCILTGVIISLILCTGFKFGSKKYYHYIEAFLFLVLYILYLSFVNLGQPFLNFQWDILLLETSIITILHLLFLKNIEARNIFRWIYMLLIFKLMLMSGLVKLASKDPAWADLSALQYHYFTQPIPNPGAFWIHQLPLLFHKLSCLIMFLIELIVPFFIFFGKRMRAIAGLAFIALMLIVICTGNYNFFNLLTILIALWLFEDKDLLDKLPNSLRVNLAEEDEIKIKEMKSSNEVLGSMIDNKLASLSPRVNKKNLSIVSILCFSILFVYASLDLTHIVFRAPLNNSFKNLVLPLEKFYIKNLSKFQLNSPYGLFAIMTRKRKEIIIQGANDGEMQLGRTEWKDYEFYFKPQDLRGPLFQIAPYQPRLDWQMWFASLSNARSQKWFLYLVTRLLEGDKYVLSLFNGNPFPDNPPKYIRAISYDYSFNTIEDYSKTGNVWKRDNQGIYLKEVSLKK